MTRANDLFEKRYGATPFDGSRRIDRIADKSRVVLISAFQKQLSKIDTRDGEDVQAVATGLLVGLIQVVMAHGEQTDMNHAHIRAGILQLVPWAIDLARQQHDLPPLVQS